MLNRRILRVKAFQNLYAFEQCKGSNLNLAKDFIRESFLPDLNSMEAQDKPALHREAEDAIRLFDENQEKYIKRLAELVAIPSVSAWPENRQEIVSMHIK